MNKKKIRQGQVINSPSCYADFPPPYPPGTDYWEVILEECQVAYSFEKESPNKNVKLVFFAEKISENFEEKFTVGENYIFYCTSWNKYYFPHNWKKINK